MTGGKKRSSYIRCKTQSWPSRTECQLDTVTKRNAPYGDKTTVFPKNYRQCL